jgi:hypothetical protein
MQPRGKKSQISQSQRDPEEVIWAENLVKVRRLIAMSFPDSLLGLKRSTNSRKS